MLEVHNIKKEFDGTAALNDVSVRIEGGEFFSLLGPSGCGKTTLLRIIAGLDQPDSGQVLLEGKPLLEVPAHRRPVNTVFQNYALFPHLSVGNNIGFGLDLAGVKPSEISRRTSEVLELVKLPGFEGRMIGTLSGGQKQRIALARALINRPKILLLDEPLSALDLKLRVEMRRELSVLQKHLGMTFIFVTHDQEEALAMSDRLVVMNRGKIAQLGRPRDVYQNPANLFVAKFLGEMNIFEAQSSNKTEYLTVRPEAIRIDRSQSVDIRTPTSVTGKIIAVNYKGPMIDYVVAGEDARSFLVSRSADENPEVGLTRGDLVRLAWDPEDIQMLPAEVET
jgi:ABC-type Fe3+/spermidine/putrescine transport system ATPase subunit